MKYQEMSWPTSVWTSSFSASVLCPVCKEELYVDADEPHECDCGHKFMIRIRFVEVTEE